ncbi:hypothetical protein [Dietzia maris]|uniref:hypothetical protein n=1 Tax=Dietzia maris TaxID=37915 RepID=UPI0037C68F20
MNIAKVAPLILSTVVVTVGCSPGESGNVTEPAPSREATSQAQDATAVAEDLKAGSDTATKVVTINEDNDPNDKIGRPNGYKSAAVLYDSQLVCDSLGVGCGVTVEVFPDDSLARARADHLQSVHKSMPMLGSEWNYVKGPVLVRITGELKPSAAAVYANRFGGEEVVPTSE